MNKRSVVTIVVALIVIATTLWLNGPNKITETYPNGNLKLTKEYKDSQPYGIWTTWSIDGSKLSEVKFIKDSLIEEFRTYHPNGYVKNSMVAFISWPGEFTKGRDTVRFVLETYDDQGNRIENNTESGAVEDIDKGVTYLFPWYDGTNVVGLVKTE